MKVTEITASRSARVNTAQYEHTDVFLSMKAVLEDEDDPVQCTKDLNQLVERRVVMNIVALYKATGKPKSKEQVIAMFGFGCA